MERKLKMATIFDKYHNQHFSGGKSSHANFNILKKNCMDFPCIHYLGVNK